MKLDGLRPTIFSAIAGFTAAMFLGGQAATAEDNGPTQTGQICMQKVFGVPVTNANQLNCTANDIRISGVALDQNGDPKVNPDTCLDGTTFDLTATFLIDVTANSRYDAGFFFRIDGTGTARGDEGMATGECSLSALDPAIAPAQELDGDSCGDLNSGVYEVTFTIPDVECVGVPDPNHPGQFILRLPNCTSWHNNQGTLCDITDEFDFQPDTKSKCVCDDNFTVPVIVETAKLTVVKEASPAQVSETGGTVTYTAKVTNDAQFVSVLITSVVDDLYGDLTDPTNTNITDSNCATAVEGKTLGPGQSAMCSFKAFVSGDSGQVVTDTVEICGDQTNTDKEICDDDPADVTITDVPAIPALDKTVTAASCKVDVTYQVVVSNNSVVNDMLTVDALTDDGFGDITQKQGAVVDTTCVTGATIAKGDNYTCTFVARIDDGDCNIDHKDEVTGDLTDDDLETYSPKDTAVVQVKTTIP